MEPAPIEEDLAIRVQHEVRCEVARRVRVGSLVYPGLVLLLGLATPLGSLHPRMFTIGFFALLGLGIFRARLALEPKNSRSWDVAFLGICVGLGGLWGIGVAYLVSVHGLVNPIYVTLLVLCGICAGVTNALAPDRTTLRLVQIFQMGPVLLAVFALGSSESFGLGCFCLVYTLYLAGQGVTLHNSFLSLTTSTILLDIKSKQLEEAKRSAEQAGRVKSEFLANVSHEIRTPINGVIGMTDEVLLTELSSSQREDLMVVRESALSLLDVINQILDFSRLEAGQVPTPRREEFSLDRLIFDTLRIFSNQAEKQGLVLYYSISSEIGSVWTGDAVRLRQVLTNLVDNALKFTSQGSVSLSVVPGRRGPEFWVRDTGIGIDLEDVERIFEPFSQSDSSLTRPQRGTGLGLAIVRQLVREMDGEVVVHSHPGKGSRFVFDCPALTVSQTVERPLQGFQVVVLDNLELRKNATVTLLRRWGVQVRLEPRPGVWTLFDSSVLTDLDWSRWSRERLVLVVSPPGIKLELPAGWLSLSGPLGIDGILAALSGSFTAANSDRVSAASSAEGLRLRILLAEDQPTNSELIRRILERWGHSVVVANNGREAVAYFQRESFDLVLMDVQMPLMDGYQATAAIRACEGGASVPIVAVTAHAVKGDEETCLAAGMDAYVSKPLDRQRLRSTIDSFFS